MTAWSGEIQVAETVSVPSEVTIGSEVGVEEEVERSPGREEVEGGKTAMKK